MIRVGQVIMDWSILVMQDALEERAAGIVATPSWAMYTSRAGPLYAFQVF